MKKAFIAMLFIFSIMIVGCESGTTEVPPGGPEADAVPDTSEMEAESPADPGPDAEEEAEAEAETDGEG